MSSDPDSPVSNSPSANAVTTLAEAGIAALERNDLAAAIDFLSQAAAADPTNAAHRNNLGLALEAAERWGEARANFERAVAVAPYSATAHYNLGGLHLACGDYALAEASYRTALEVDPQNAAVCNNLGLSLSNQNRRDEAVDFFRMALQLRPDYAAALSNLGKTLFEVGQLSAAEQCLRQALAINPQLAAAHNNLGMVLLEHSVMDDSIACFRRAIELDAGLADAHDNWGVALRESGKPAEAIARHEQAHRLQPGLASAVYNRGVAQVQLGRFDEAARDFRRALQINPQLVAAYFHLAQMRHPTFCDEDVARLEEILLQPELPAKDRSFAAFALGNAYDARREFDRAFACFDQANRLAARDYDPAAHENFVDRLISVFSAERLRSSSFAQNDDERPVFIVGMPRSGTTLVEQIISSHPAAAAGGEQLPLDRIAAKLSDGVGSLDFPEVAALLDNAAADAAARQYVGALDERAGDASRVTDKLPSNYLYLGLAALLFPQATIIHCRRHPLDTCVSCFFQNFEQSPYAFDFAHLASRFRAYRRLMEHWSSVLPITIHHVDYEALVDDPDTVSRNLIAACGLPWDERCLSPHRNARPVDTASVWQVRQPIYRNSVARWRNYRQHLQPLIDALGDAVAD